MKKVFVLLITIILTSMINKQVSSAQHINRPLTSKFTTMNIVLILKYIYLPIDLINCSFVIQWAITFCAVA